MEKNFLMKRLERVKEQRVVEALTKRANTAEDNNVRGWFYIVRPPPGPGINSQHTGSIKPLQFGFEVTEGRKRFWVGAVLKMARPRRFRKS